SRKAPSRTRSPTSSRQGRQHAEGRGLPALFSCRERIASLASLHIPCATTQPKSRSRAFASIQTRQKGFQHVFHHLPRRSRRHRARDPLLPRSGLKLRPSIALTPQEKLT